MYVCTVPIYASQPKCYEVVLLHRTYFFIWPVYLTNRYIFLFVEHWRNQLHMLTRPLVYVCRYGSIFVCAWMYVCMYVRWLYQSAEVTGAGVRVDQRGQESQGRLAQIICTYIHTYIHTYSVCSLLIHIIHFDRCEVTCGEPYHVTPL